MDQATLDAVLSMIRSENPTLEDMRDLFREVYRSDPAAVARAEECELSEDPPEHLRYFFETMARTDGSVGETLVSMLVVNPSESEEDARISCLVTRDGHRRQGYAEALVRTIMTKFTGRISVKVKYEDEASRALFKKLGFEIYLEVLSEDGSELILSRSS